MAQHNIDIPYPQRVLHIAQGENVPVLLQGNRLAP